MTAITTIEALVIMTSIPGLGPMKIRQLLDRFSSPTEALMTSPAAIAALPGFEKIAPHWNAWKSDRSWGNEIQAAERSGTVILPFTSPDYPKALLHIPDAPILLYIQGNLLPIDTQRSIAIVGTRQASIYGLEMAEMIAQSLAAQGFTVISGLARGIDTAAHKGALKSGRTLAVIGSGLHDIYPPENRTLAASIRDSGALISEFSMHTPPDRQNFPQRNRIVSALSTGVLLIEAPLKSGAMITMEKAQTHRKKLFAIPGRADMETFRGNHMLIKHGHAHLVENAEDIVRHYENLFPMGTISPKPLVCGVAITSEEKSFLDKLPTQEIGIEAIANATGVPMGQINSLLMGLMIKKRIKEFPGKVYKKI